MISPRASERALERHDEGRRRVQKDMAADHWSGPSSKSSQRIADVGKVDDVLVDRLVPSEADLDDTASRRATLAILAPASRPCWGGKPRGGQEWLCPKPSGSPTLVSPAWPTTDPLARRAPFTAPALAGVPAPRTAAGGSRSGAGRRSSAPRPRCPRERRPRPTSGAGPGAAARTRAA